MQTFDTLYGILNYIVFVLELHAGRNLVTEARNFI